MRPFLVLLVVLFAAVPAAAQERPSPFAGDARLQKTVTVRWKKATLYDALKTVEQMTGVHLTPERSLVDEPIMASAANVPARALLEQVAKLLHFTWARSGGTADAPHYLLYRDQRAMQEEEDEINGARRAVLEALQKEIDRHRQIAKMPPDQLQNAVRKADEDTMAMFSGGNFASMASSQAAAQKFQQGQAVRTVASPIGRALLDFLDSFPSGTWNAMQSEDPLIFSTNPKAGEERLPQSVGDRLAGGTPGWPFPKGMFKAFGPQVEDGIAKAEEAMAKQWTGAPGFKVTVHLTLNTASQPIGMLRVNPEPLGEGTSSPLFAMTGLNLIGAPGLLTPPTEDPEEREKRLAADPFLGRKAVLKLPPLPPAPPAGPFAILGQSHRVAEILPNVEDAFKVRIVGDAYNRMAMSLLPNPGEAPIALYKVLDQMAGLGRAWERDGDVIRLRSKTWAHDRRGEIPSRYMRRWIAIREKKGGFTLDDIAEMASLLRDEQVDSLLYSAMEEGMPQGFEDFFMVSANKQPLRFYGKLLPAQRRQLLAGKALPVRSLFAYQQQALMGMNREQNRSMFSFAFGTKPARRPDQLAAAVVSVEHKQAGDAGKVAVLSPGRGSAVVEPGGVYVLRVAFPDGQKDEFTIPLSRPAGKPASLAVPEAPKPPAPAAPASK